METKLAVRTVEQWIEDHAYDVDDIVLGDQGLTISQLASLHDLLDIVRPEWRGVFERV